jgi:hypothetical protein
MVLIGFNLCHSIIWNIATPDIKGFFDIEAFNIEVLFDIE